ncbi:hypothetical protein ABIC20_005722 [Methylobacterium radiotolerans]|uniref:Uncharacterized protein n=1 Tax=Methylobacterium radiotolerans TaxID=31998 RepID=A0ABV2NPV4_9HYPH
MVRDAPRSAAPRAFSIRPLDPRLVGDLRAGELEAAEDRGQQVVEVVRDATREGAQRLHLVRLAQARLQGPLLGHVALDHREVTDRPARVADRHPRHVAPLLGAGRAVADEALGHRAGPDRRRVRRRHGLGLRSKKFVLAPPEAGGDVVAQEGGLAAVQPHEAARRVLEADRVLGVVEESAQERPLGGEVPAEAVALEGLPDGGAEQSGIPGLGDVADDAAPVEGGDHRGDVGVAGQQDRLRVVEGAGLGEERVAREARHPLVREHDGDVGLGAQDLQRLGRARGRQNPVGLLEQVLQGDQDVRLVVDGQDRPYTCRTVTHALAACRGIPITKQAPPPGAVSTVSEPLCA